MVRGDGGGHVSEVPLGWPEPREDGLPYVKICGMRDPKIAEKAIAAGADMLGVVHFENSPRHVGPGVMREIGDAIAGDGWLVLLTVDAIDKELDYLIQRARPDALQLHGRESPDRVAELAMRYDIPVAKAFGVATADDLIPAARYRDTLMVVDAKAPADADRPGGHGATFDWSILTALTPKRPFMLSGGLNAGNVTEAVRQTGPYAVDVSSGVEVDGEKDPLKIAAFIKAARPGAPERRHAGDEDPATA